MKEKSINSISVTTNCIMAYTILDSGLFGHNKVCVGETQYEITLMYRY